MKKEINNNKLGLVLGIFAASIHAVWVLAVAIFPNTLQTIIDWVFGIHFLEATHVITVFSPGKAVLLVGLAFVVGYLAGWVFSAIWNFIKE